MRRMTLETQPEKCPACNREDWLKDGPSELRNGPHDDCREVVPHFHFACCHCGSDRVLRLMGA